MQNKIFHWTRRVSAILLHYKSLQSRAEKICSSQQILSSEKETINKQLRENNYPSRFVKSIKANHRNSLDPSNRKNYLSTLYIKGASEKVEKLLKPFNLKLSNKSSNTLRTQLCKLKDKKKKEESSNVVY